MVEGVWKGDRLYEGKWWTLTQEEGRYDVEERKNGKVVKEVRGVQ